MANTNRELPRSLENFARGLLATTCLTVACGTSALAGTITEGTAPAPGSFPDTPNGYLLPVGTTVVIGTVPIAESGGPEKWFEFQGLTPFASYTLTGATSIVESGMGMNLFDDSGTPGNLLGVGAEGAPGFASLEQGVGNFITFNSPADGNAVVEMFRNCENSCGGDFTDTLTANSNTPEPATFGVAALGLGAIALAWRRRRAL